MKTNRSTIILAMLIALLFETIVQAQERRRWSPQAKGTAIGAGVGGAAGAIIHKRNRLVGGLIGGAAGAAGGYAIGKGVDNRRKTNARIAAAEREAAAARREAAEARRESALARQEVANRPAMATRPAAVGVAAGQKTPVPAVVESTDEAGLFSSMAYRAQGIKPYAGNALFLPNDAYGNHKTAYPTSEIRRKSW